MIGLPSEWFDENPRGGATVNANHPPAGAPVLPLLVSSRGFELFIDNSGNFEGNLVVVLKCQSSVILIYFYYASC